MKIAFLPRLLCLLALALASPAALATVYSFSGTLNDVTFPGLYVLLRVDSQRDDFHLRRCDQSGDRSLRFGTGSVHSDCCIVTTNSINVGTNLSSSVSAVSIHEGTILGDIAVVEVLGVFGKRGDSPFLCPGFQCSSPARQISG